jgi:cytochrome b
VQNKVRVWDLPTRIFHWALLVCVIGLAITGLTGGGLLTWHARLGYAILSLLLFRVLWGLIGGRWSRFASFIYSPGSVVNYLRGQAHPDHLVGHNPVGAGSVFAMLLFLLAQVGTGLVADDEIAFTGPLNRFVDTANGLLATWYHKRVGIWILLALIVLHVAAVLFYLWKKKENLIMPMIDGDKTVSAPVVPSRDDAASHIVAVVVLGVCVGFVTWIVKLGG